MLQWLRLVPLEWYSTGVTRIGRSADLSFANGMPPISSEINPSAKQVQVAQRPRQAPTGSFSNLPTWGVFSRFALVNPTWN